MASPTHRRLQRLALLGGLIGTLTVHGALVGAVTYSLGFERPKPEIVEKDDKDRYAQLKAIRDKVELPKPKPPKKEEEVKPPEPPPPPPEPPKAEEKPKPEPPKPPPKKVGKKKKKKRNLVKKKGQPKKIKPKKAAPKDPPNKAEPMPLTLGPDAFGNKGKVKVQRGEQDLFGDPDVEATDSNTNVEAVDDPDEYAVDGSDDGNGGDEPARVCKTKQPVPTSKTRSLKGSYPSDAPRMGRRITVVLSIRVGTDGKPKSVKVVKGAGAAFDKEARRIGMKTRFRPGERDCAVVEMPVRWAVDFDPSA